MSRSFRLDLQVIQEVLNRYRFTDYKVRLSLRGAGGKYVQDDEKWTRAEAALRAALVANQVDFYEAEGEAAFYGPKADFIARDVLGREWQLSTIQVDFIQPARLGCGFIGEDGAEHTPVVLHRAVTGTTERFLGVIIEHFAGAFPVWLAPVQAMVVPIADRHLEYAQKVAADLRVQGFRVEVDSRNDRMNAKTATRRTRRFPTCWWSATRKPRRERWRCACATATTPARCLWRILWQRRRRILKREFRKLRDSHRRGDCLFLDRKLLPLSN